MGKENYWKYYIGFDVPCGGLSVSPKPVRLLDWEKFIPVAYEMFRLNNELLRKRLKLDESVLLYDYVIDYMIKMAEERFGQEGSFALVLISSIFSLCYRLPVEPMLQKKEGSVGIVFKIGDDEENLITRYNYEEIREVIMEQNLIFDPIVAPNKKSQEAIDKAIERKKSMGGGVEINMESMIILVSKSRPITEDYTYYQLQADYEMVLRLEQSRAIPTYRAVGADIDPIELGAILSIHENPYSFEKMFKKNDRSKDSDNLKATK
jgi:hypothetical protein